MPHDLSIPAPSPASALSSPAPAASRTETALIVAGLVLACAAVWIAQTRTYTYVSGQDPMTFIHLARQYLGLALPDQAVSHRLVAPGHPILLAGAIRAFGPLAPYWINAVLMVLAVPLLWRLLTLLTGNRLTALVAVLTTGAVIVSGHPNNVHFLLYPFRETTGLLTLGIALLVFVLGMRAAGNRAQIALGAAAACAALLASAVRETALLGFGGILLYAVAVPSVRRRCWRVPASFALTLLIALGAVLALAGPSAISEQWNTLPVLKEQFGFQGFLRRTSLNEQALRSMLLGELGAAGLCLLAIGLLTARRHAMLAVTAGFPAVAWHLCHAMNEAHPRYALYSLVCLGVICGAGIGALLADLTSRWVRAPRLLVPSLYAAAVLVLGAVILNEVYLCEPWGPRVRRGQVEAFYEAVSRAPPAAKSIFVTDGDRYILDAALTHTTLRILTPQNANPKVLRREPVLTVRGLNRDAGFSGGYHPYAGLPAPDILGHFADVREVRDTAAAPVRFHLGKGEYELLCSTAWTQTEWSANMPVRQDSDTVFWLDFGFTPPGAQRMISAVQPGGPTLFSGRSDNSAELVPVFIPHAALTSNCVRLTVTSDSPFPANPVRTTQIGNEPASFLLDANRTLSIQDWFGIGFSGRTPVSKYGAMFVGNGAMTIPTPQGIEGLNMALAFNLRPPLREPGSAPMGVTVRVDGQATTNWFVPPRASTWHGVTSPIGPTGKALVGFETDGKRRRDVLRINRLLIFFSARGTP